MISRYSYSSVKTAVPGVKNNLFTCHFSDSVGLQYICTANYLSDSYSGCYRLDINCRCVGSNGLSVGSQLDCLRKFSNVFSGFLVHQNIAICNGSEVITDYDPQYSNLFGL